MSVLPGVLEFTELGDGRGFPTAPVIIPISFIISLMPGGWLVRWTRGRSLSLFLNEFTLLSVFDSCGAEGGFRNGVTTEP